MRRIALAALALAVVASAAVYVSEGGDVVYFSTLGRFGALNGLGQLLWVVDAPSPLIATDPMGSCLAVGYSVSNGTAWLGYRVELYVRGVPLWSATLRFNASAIATDCNRVAAASLRGDLVELAGGRVVGYQFLNASIISLLYDGGRLRYGVWKPSRIEHPLRFGHLIVLQKAERPYVVVDGREYVGYGEMLALTPPAAVSQNGVLAFATEGTVYWGQRVIKVREPVYSLTVSGDGNVLALGFADRVELYRFGALVATVEASMPRSLALDFRGYTLAVQDDRGVRVYSFTESEIAVSGCPYGIVTAGVAVYNITGSAVVYVPRGAELRPLAVNLTDSVCRVQNFDGRVVAYQRLYRVEVVPPAKGPELAAGSAVYAAPLEAEVRSALGTVKAYLAGWLVGGQRLQPLAVVTVDVRGPTKVAPLYRLDIPREVVEGGVRRVLRGVAAYDARGMPMAPVEELTYVGLPSYVEATYDVYHLLRVEALGNVTELWLKPGGRVVISAPPLADFGNGTRLVFQRWSDGAQEPKRTVGPGTYVAQYVRQYLVTYTAPNFTYSVWVAELSRPPAVRPPAKLYDDGGTRVYFQEWQNLPERVTEPVNVTASVAREFRVVLRYPWGEEERWVPEGYALLPPDRDRYNVFWKFAGWSPSSVVAAPGVYTAVYELDTLAVAAVASVAVIAAAAAVWLKRR